MAIDAEDREDLLGQATGLPVRAQFEGSDLPDVVLGFRRNGSASWYFGADPVFQFDNQYRLRRVYCDGQRYAVSEGRIIQLHQPQLGGQLKFQREPVSDDRQRQILSLWQAKVTEFRQAWQTKTIAVSGCSIDQHEFAQRVDQWLAHLPESITIAPSL